MLKTIEVDSCIFVSGTFHLDQAIYQRDFVFSKKKRKKGDVVSDHSVQVDPWVQCLVDYCLYVRSMEMRNMAAKSACSILLSQQ